MFRKLFSLRYQIIRELAWWRSLPCKVSLFIVTFRSVVTIFTHAQAYFLLKYLREVIKDSVCSILRFSILVIFQSSWAFVISLFRFMANWKNFFKNFNGRCLTKAMKTFQTLQSALLDLYVHAHKCSLRPSVEFITFFYQRWLHLTRWLHWKKNIKSMSNNIRSTFWIMSYTRTLPWYSLSLGISDFSCYPLNNSGIDSGFCAWNVATTQGRFAKRSPGTLFCINSSPTCPKRLWTYKSHIFELRLNQLS